MPSITTPGNNITVNAYSRDLTSYDLNYYLTKSISETLDDEILLDSSDLGSENLLKISTIYGVAGVIRLLAGILFSRELYLSIHIISIDIINIPKPLP